MEVQIKSECALAYTVCRREWMQLMPTHEPSPTRQFRRFAIIPASNLACVTYVSTALCSN